MRDCTPQNSIKPNREEASNLMKIRLMAIGHFLFRPLITLYIMLFGTAVMAQQIEPTYVSISDGLVSTNVQDVIQDSYGLIWIATTNGLQTYDGYAFKTFKNIPGKPGSLQNNQTWGLLEDTGRNIWVASELGVSRYDRLNNRFVNYNFTEDLKIRTGEGFTFNLFMDSQQRLWAATRFLELLMYNPQTDKWESARYDAPNAAQTPHFGVAMALTEDVHGGLWLGSGTYGLMHRAPDETAFVPVSADRFGGFDFIRGENFITALHSDSSNTLWITTRIGVYKYHPESGSFKTIREYSEAQLDIWNHWNSILPDPEGNILISNNFRGILKFDGISDRFEEISVAGKVRMREYGWNITFTDFMIDRSGIFWFGTREQGLLKHDPVSRPFSNYAHDIANPLSISPNGVYGILASKVRPGTIYVGTRGGGLNVFDPAGGTFEKVTYKVVDDRFGGSVRGIAESPDGSLWLGTWGDGLIRMDRNYREVRRYKYAALTPTSISNNLVRVIRPDNQGRLWVGTNSGLNVLDIQTGAFQRIASKNTRSYPGELISKLEAYALTYHLMGAIDQVTDFEDRSMAIEITTGGAYLIMSVGEGLSSSGMSDYGWLENDSKDTVWHFGDYKRTFWAGGAVKNRIIIETVTLPPGAYTLRYRSDDSHSYNAWNAEPPDQTSLYGIVLIKPDDPEQVQQLMAQVPPDAENFVLNGDNISDIEFEGQYVWVSANGDGLHRIDPAGQTIIHYEHDPLDENSISSNQILDILIDSQGMLWLATDEGISKFDPDAKRFIRYSEADGLPTNLTEAILEGDDGQMWIATQNGISQMVTNEALGKVTFINYNSTDGLGGDAFLALAATRAPDGKFYFGGDHGLTVVNRITANNTPPDILLTNLFISNRSVMDMGEKSPLKSSLPDVESITLSHDQNNLSFEFSALHFSSPQKNQYAHMLKNYDQDWIYDNRNFAAYTNLEPGKYEFLIRASNAYGIWNEEGKSIGIIIRPPWWRTWWAYGFYALILATGVFGFDRVMRRRLVLRERERSRERELAQAREIEKAYTELKATQAQLIQSEKMASLGELTAGIAHEIQNPLNFVNNFAEVSQELLDEMEDELDKGATGEVKNLSADIRQNLNKIIHHGRRADSIVKGMLQHSRSGSGQKEPTDINALADEYLRLSYHGLRAKDKSFNAEFKAELYPDLPKISAVPQEIGRVLLNLINNAFYAVDQKARQGISDYRPEVVVTTRKAKFKSGTQGIEIVVRDNGNGVPDSVREKIFQPFFTTKPAGAGTGLGLSLSYEIITKGHAGELTLDTRPGEGTSFVVLLPTTNNSQ
jgi:signal transduction histidine kinase/ligand-binding sensor domain-containing protein